jgi:4-hydroxythreonine-4-phosphate dehydrogenase
MMRNKKPIIAVTMGDPAGIGPEIAVKALLKPEIKNICKPILIGDLSILQKISQQLKLEINFKILNSPKESAGGQGVIEVIDLKNVDLASFKIGKVSVEAGRAAIQYVKKATELALNRQVDAVATGPINKQAVNLAGSPYIGHTEMLAAFCGVENPLMMFWVRGARIFFLTRHVSLVEAIKEVRKERIIEAVERIATELEKIGLKNPSVAVAALNPHASDEGLVGDEEALEIIPAINKLKSKGYNVVGPVPADTVFVKALEGRYDAVLSLYHDQGHIAAKTVDFYGTVSVTLGLPFLRTSVDHGTAYDIAGKGVADPRSLEEAIKLAAEIVSKR